MGNIIVAISQAVSDIIVALGELISSVISAIANVVTAIGQAVSDIIVALGDFCSDIIVAIGEGIANVILELSRIPGIILDLFEGLLKKLFVPDDDYYSNKVDSLKGDLNNKIPYQSYTNNLRDIGEASGSEQKSISTSIDLNNYKLSDKLTISMSNFIDFSIFSKYRDTWFVWVRVVVYILLVIYWLNEIMKFLRGFHIAGGSSAYVSQSNQTGGNEK